MERFKSRTRKSCPASDFLKRCLVDLVERGFSHKRSLNFELRGIKTLHIKGASEKHVEDGRWELPMEVGLSGSPYVWVSSGSKRC